MLAPVLLQTFLADAQTRSFTQAAERLGLRQSTVSQHIRKLEEKTGRRLFVRDTHSVTATADGEAMIEFARGILAANERAQRYFAGSQLRGRLRFGASEDFVASRLPEVLREFVRTHPLVEFELTVGLSGELNEKLVRGELDLICGKRPRGSNRGQLVSRDRLAWVSGDLPSFD
jgi:DNA-binding transcriptional LysR family regulator